LARQHYKKEYDCLETCGTNDVLPGNEMIYSLCLTYGMAFHNGDNAINLEAIISALKLEDIDVRDHRWCVRCIMAYIKTALEVVKASFEKGKN
jgi:hypothetical protein